MSMVDIQGNTREALGSTRKSPRLLRINRLLCINHLLCIKCCASHDRVDERMDAVVVLL
jgi:hypothetical protein